MIKKVIANILLYGGTLTSISIVLVFVFKIFGLCFTIFCLSVLSVCVGGALSGD